MSPSAALRHVSASWRLQADSSTSPRLPARDTRACASRSIVPHFAPDAVIAASLVDSSGHRNTAYVTGSKELVQSLGGCPPAQGFSRPAVEGDRPGRKVFGAVHAEVSALWKVRAQQPIGVLIRAALPGAVGIAEVDRHASLDPELGVLGHFRSLIPRQRLSQLLG